MAMMKAIVILEGGKSAGVRDVPMPKLRDEWVLVEVKAIGLNPTDWKHIDYGAADTGCRVGCDYAGIVEEVGRKVTRFKKGDRIAGLVHGCDKTNHENGAFGAYLIAKAHLQIHIPLDVSFEEAATLGVAMVTVGQGLYKSLGLPLPSSTTKDLQPILIYAASTATGIYGIQYAKASGMTVIATASPHNFDYLKSLGAEAVFDYRSPTCASDIKKYAENKLKLAWDCMGTGVEICATALSDTEMGVYGTINPADEKLLKETNPKVDGPRFTIGYDAFGETYVFMGNEVAPKPDEMEFATAFFEMSEGLLYRGVIKPIKPIVNKIGKGLDGVLKGLDDLRANNVSGTRLVYTL